MTRSLSTAFAAGLALLALPHSGTPASAQPISAAHDDVEWELDRQAPYAGSGWLESEGGTAAVEFPSSGIDLRSWISLPEPLRRSPPCRQAIPSQWALFSRY